jgi:NAD(P)H-hydrate epimerase
MKRDPQSHKGENGKVAIIGGSFRMHGAPIFSALAAEASGADLIYLALPNVHQEIARMHSLNFQVHPFIGDALTKKDVSPLLQLLATMDSAVIGPGLDRTDESLGALRSLIAAAPCTLVLDASALQPWTLDAVRGKSAILTPHLGELERMKIALDDISQVAADAGITIHVKGPTDHIASSTGEVRSVEGGHPGLTVGGTGDALAGLIAGLVSQHLDPFEACIMASTVIKRAGVLLAETQPTYRTVDVIEQIPHLLHSL